jgi:hypothetical protein
LRSFLRVVRSIIILNDLNIDGDNRISVKAEDARLLMKIASTPHLSLTIRIKLSVIFRSIPSILNRANFLAFLSILNFTKGIMVNESRNRIREV